LKRNGIYRVDWCPLCRQFLPHFREGNTCKKYEQAKRLVLASSQTASREDSLQQGIQLLRELLETRNPIQDLHSMTLQLTLAKALYKQQTQSSLQQAFDTLTKMLVQEQQEQFLSSLFSKQHLPFHRRKVRKKLAQAHFLLAQVLEGRRSNGHVSNSPQHHYDQAVRLDPTNLTLLIACAKRSRNDNPTKAMDYHRQVLQHSKYHVDCNLYVASQYQQYLRQVTTRPPPQGSLNAILTSYLACVVRAEYKLQQQSRHGNAEGNDAFNNLANLQNKCHGHREFLARCHATFSDARGPRMDHVSAAFVTVLDIPLNMDEEEQNSGTMETDKAE
jgi:hypothetical protein